MTLDILSCILGGGSLITLIIFLIKRHDEHKEKNDSLVAEIKGMNERFDKLEKDTIRTQLLLLMNTYQFGDASEIFTCAEHYFVKLKGDWYLTSLFQKFCKTNCLDLPPWFNGKQGE